MKFYSKVRQKRIWLTLFFAIIFMCFVAMGRPVSAKTEYVKNVRIEVGQSYTMSVKKAPSKVKWFSSKKSVVKIKEVKGNRNRKVVIYGVKEGTAFITAEAGKSKLKAKIVVDAAGDLYANTNYKKAPKMRGDGVYQVSAKKDNSIVCFIAPSSGIWTITISDIHLWNVNSANDGDYKPCYGKWLPLALEKVGDKYYLTNLKVRTQGGKTDGLWTADEPEIAKTLNRGEKTVNKCLLSRKCVVKLKKGQSIYFEYNYALGTACKYKLTVKRK